jgi:tRNA pseudouridine38-40 synthase
VYERCSAFPPFYRATGDRKPLGALDEGRTWKLVLAYDGTEFHGWQIQSDRVTVQGELYAAIERVTGETVLPQGSGRTDAGVHALGQVASFVLSAPIPESNFARALNRTLPAAIRVLSAEIAPQGFHARHSAIRKTYEYRIFLGRICPPWLARYVYGLDQSLDLQAMQSAAAQILGEHDFTSFAASDPDRSERAGICEQAATESRPGTRGNLKTIYSSEWIVPTGISLDSMWQIGNWGGSTQKVEPQEWKPRPRHRTSERALAAEGGLLLYRVRGSGFLHHMVRNLVGTFLDVGRGKLSSNDIPGILEARSRPQAGPTAPARGLWLAEVEYSENLG